MKKILLIIAIEFCIFQMVVLATAIDVGSAAIDRSFSWTSLTYVAKENPANATGQITSIEIWAAVSLTDCKVATFFVVSGNNLSTRDTETIGAVTAGAKRTFEVDLDVQVGDYIGIYFTAGEIELTTSGTGIWTFDGDKIPCTNQLFTAEADRLLSLYGTGTTEVGITWNGVTITKLNGVTITKINGK